MRRIDAGLMAVGLLLAGCTASRLPEPAAPVPDIAGMGLGGPTCRVGPDGGPVLADRGIGGTGGPASAVETADRGIGGTGVVGVITGFASICLGGREIGYAPGVPVVVDDRPGGAADLRAGQFAAVEAGGPDAGLQARRVMVRHEVSGPIEAMEPEGLRVAGQRVVVRAATLGERDLPIGAWVAVSGFRDAAGVIQATRLDRRARGDVRVHGLLVHEGGRWRIGTLEVRLPPGPRPSGGPFMAVVDGRYADGVLLADSVVADPWAVSLGGVGPFGSRVGFVVVETYAGFSGGRFLVGRSEQDRAGVVLRQSQVALERRGDGSFQPAGLRSLGAGFGGGGLVGPRGNTEGGVSGPRRFEPAPVPSRGSMGGFAGDRVQPGGNDGGVRPGRVTGPGVGRGRGL